MSEQQAQYGGLSCRQLESRKASILSSPESSNWLKTAILESWERDIHDAITDIETLWELLKAKEKGQMWVSGFVWGKYGESRYALPTLPDDAREWLEGFGFGSAESGNPETIRQAFIRLLSDKPDVLRVVLNASVPD